MSRKKKPSVVISMIPVVLLVGLLSYCITVFGDGMLSGPSQLVLTLCTGVVVAISMLVYKQSWQSLENAMVVGISRSMSANLILLMVGGLCGTWMHSGIIPTMIYYGLEVISARWLLLTSCVLCALVSLCIGSSWTTIATIGVGLMGIGRTLGLEDGWVAGAIISGAYFGDKMSPLSETTNLASSISDVPLFTHIKNLLHTTVPTLLITLVAFTVVGLTGGGGADIDTNAAVEMQHHLNATFPITMWLLLLPLLVFFLIYKGMAATMVLFIGMLLGGIIVCFTQGFDFAIECAFGEVGYTTGVDTIDSLTSTRGMGGMLYTIWLIICSMSFGGVMERSGMLESITEYLLKVIKGRTSAVATTCMSSIFLNVTTGDQIISIILPSKMYGSAFDRLKLPRKLMSRSLEDGGTVTSVLVPWNSCGMTQSTVLGVATTIYAPYTLFCWISPLISVIAAFVKQYIMKKEDQESDFVTISGQEEGDE
ncbi:MAG: Na+/H+ antiporter NhaC [Bacteroidales bacterium]|nr:Na+/H+ antiporter NhaC [Bacteroidales bacterium]